MQPGQVIHDLLLQALPANAEHPADCPYCAAEPEEPVKTYTEDELHAAVADAVAKASADLQPKLAELAAAERQAEIDAAVEASLAGPTAKTTELEATVADLQSQLDAKVLEAVAEKERADGVAAWLDAEAERIATEAAIAARRDERVAEVAAVVTFPAEHVAANTERWATMSDAEFGQQLADYRLLADKHPKTKLAPPAPKRSALTAAAEDAPVETTGRFSKGMRDVVALRNKGIDTRSV